MDESSRLTKTKEQWAKARRGGEEREVFYEGDDRLPRDNMWWRPSPS